jgi:hypothetical protein
MKYEITFEVTKTRSIEIEANSEEEAETIYSMMDDRELLRESIEDSCTDCEIEMLSIDRKGE